jgi:hypothetical protein
MLHGVLIFALGFGQLAMLGWLAAAAVPLVIHLWNQRRYREVTWAAMEYLLAAIQKNSRRLHLEQWLLLAIRTAIILLVVLAVAGPYLEQAATPFLTGRPTHKVLVIDGSYSMAYRAGDKSRFERALEVAADVVDQSREGDAFTLILMGVPPRVIVGTPSFSRSEFLMELENLKLQHGGADVDATLSRVEDTLKNVARNQSRLVQHEVYFLTDLGRTTWESASSADGSARRQLARLAEEARVWMVDLGQHDTSNLAITQLAAGQAWFTTASENDFQATVKSYSATTERRKVELVVDNQRTSEETVEVPPGGEAAVTFRYHFPSPGEHAVEVRLAGDALDVDDRRWLAAPVKRAIETLIVNGEADPRAANYLRFALDPDSGDDGAATTRSPVHATVVAETALLETDLSRFDCLFLSNVGQFTRGEAQALGAFVQGGGGLVFFLGNRVLANRYNEELGAARGIGRLLPVVLEAPVPSSQYSFAPLGYAHPIVSVFRGNENAGLLQTFVAQYYRMKLPDAGQTKAQIALAFAETGDPAIVTESIGRGRVTVLAVPASFESVDRATGSSWTVMPATPSFQPVVQEILAWTLRGQNQSRAALVGEPISATAPVAATDTSLALATPDGRNEQIRVAAIDDETRWSFGDTWYSGIYDVEQPGGSADRQLFAVNVDTRESDLAKLALDELPESIMPLGQGDETAESTATSAVGQSELARPLLYSALALLLIESCLAWYWGYRAS